MTETPFLVRLRAPGDDAACTAALRLVYEADGYPSSWPDDPDAWLAPGGIVAGWVALRDATVVGHVLLCTIDPEEDPQFAAAAKRPSDELAEVKRLFVVPEARGRGIALTLLETAARHALARDLHPVLETTAERNPALRFYERHGWRRIGTGLANWTRASGERPLLHQYEPLPETYAEPQPGISQRA